LKLTQNFSLEEMTHSDVAQRRGFINQPNDEQIKNLEHLCNTLLEPIRSLLGCPLHINSGFRSSLVNSMVGGVHNSAHLDGRAADFVPIGKDLRACFEFIRLSDLPYDQVILECGTWIHVAWAENPRKQALTASGKPGAWHYERVS